MLNAQGKVSEASGMNIFIVRNGQLITPGFEQDILEGITRDSVLTWLEIWVFRRSSAPLISPSCILPTRFFLTGTAAKVAPVKRVENYMLPVDRPLTEQLRTKLIAITEKREPQYQDWVDTIAFS